MAHPLVELCFARAADDSFVGAAARSRSERTAAEAESLAVLAQKIRRNDEVSFERLFQCMHTRLARLATAIVDGDAASDIVAEVFVSIWESRSSWDPADVEAFLYRSVRNRSLNYLQGDRREHRRRDVYMADALVDMPPDPFVTPEDDLRTSAVQAAVAELNPRQREYVVLRWQENRTPAEIAALLGTTVRAVTSLQDRTLAALRRRAPEIFAQLRGR